MDFDWDLIADAVSDLHFQETLDLLGELEQVDQQHEDRDDRDDGRDEVEQTPRNSPGDTVDFGGADGLLAAMSGGAKSEGLEWLEKELCTGAFDPRTIQEEKERESERRRVAAATELQRLREQRCDQRCERGECCVYNLWYDPEYFWNGHDRNRCKHVCGPTIERPSSCSAQVLPNSLFSIFPPWIAGVDRTNSLYGGASKYASYNRWQNLKREHNAKDGNLVSEAIKAGYQVSPT